MANSYLDFQSAIVAQEANGSAVAAGSFCAGAETQVINNNSGNGKGAFYFEAFFNVTIANAGDGGVEVWLDGSHDTTLSGNYRYALTGKVNTGETGRIHLGQLYLPQYSKLKWKAVDFDVDGELILVPVRGAAS